MNPEISPRKLEMVFQVTNEFLKVYDKYKDGPIPLDGKADAVSYAFYQMLFYSEVGDMAEHNSWWAALLPAMGRSSPNWDRLKAKLQSEAEALSGESGGDSEMIMHAKALLNLAKSF